MSEFQRRVLEVVAKIPRGRVATYKEVARAVGRPKAWRAVGSALARNPHPVEIPCHRVVRSDGRVGGYRSGTRRKEKFLAGEGVEIVDGKIYLKKYKFRL